MSRFGNEVTPPRYGWSDRSCQRVADLGREVLIEAAVLRDELTLGVDNDMAGNQLQRALARQHDVHVAAGAGGPAVDQVDLDDPDPDGLQSRAGLQVGESARDVAVHESADRVTCGVVPRGYGPGGTERGLDGVPGAVPDHERRVGVDDLAG